MVIKFTKSRKMPRHRFLTLLGTTSLKLRGLSLAGSRMDVYYDHDAITITLTAG